MKCIVLLVLTVLWATTIAMIVAGFRRNDPELVCAGASCFGIVSFLLTFLATVPNEEDE